MWSYKAGSEVDVKVTNKTTSCLQSPLCTFLSNKNEKAGVAVSKSLEIYELKSGTIMTLLICSKSIVSILAARLQNTEVKYSQAVQTLWK